jgi:hypothetical protein
VTAIFFSHYLINDTTFGKRYWTYNVSFDFLYNLCLKHFLLWEEPSEQPYITTALLSCQISMELAFSRQIFKSSSNIKFHKNQSRESRIVPCGRTDGEIDRQRDVTKLIVAFRNFATAPRNISSASLEMTANVVYSEPTRTSNVLCYDVGVLYL